MDFNIKDKVIIVTGGSKGIGEGIVRCLAEEGAVPIVLGRAKEFGESLINKLNEKHGIDGMFIQAELSELDQCKNAIDLVMNKYDRIDSLVNNAGVNDSVGLEAGNPDDFLKSMDKNLYHYYYLAHYALPALKESEGSIVNISSKTALTGQGGTSGYAASKGAQLALTREWAVELLKYNINVNAVIPAEVMTPLYDKWLSSFDDPEQKLKDITKNIPLGQRMTTKGEIAAMTTYLLSKQAAHITGQFLHVDGGYVHLDRSLAGKEK